MFMHPGVTLVPGIWDRHDACMEHLHCSDCNKDSVALEEWLELPFPVWDSGTTLSLARQFAPVQWPICYANLQKKNFPKSLSGTILYAKQYAVESWKTQYTLSILQKPYLGSRAGRRSPTWVITAWCQTLQGWELQRNKHPRGETVQGSLPKPGSFSWRVCLFKYFLSALASSLVKEECHGCRNRANGKATRYLWHKCMGLIRRKC